MLITVDAGRLWRAHAQGVFQPVESALLNERIPAHLREPGGHWFGLSKRARVIVYNKAAGRPEGVARYEDLAGESLRGKVCMRSSGNIYNLSLLGSLVEHHGEPGRRGLGARRSGELPSASRKATTPPSCAPSPLASVA